MAEVPVTIQAMVYPRDKSGDPYPATIVGFAEITGLKPGGGPILPPDEVPPVEPPLGIWPNPPEGQAPHPEHPIVIPEPPIPPDVTPPTTDKVHEGWNFNDGSNPKYPNTGWYYVYVPAPGSPGPKRR